MRPLLGWDVATNSHVSSSRLQWGWGMNVRQVPSPSQWLNAPPHLPPPCPALSRQPLGWCLEPAGSDRSSFKAPAPLWLEGFSHPMCAQSVLAGEGTSPGAGAGCPELGQPAHPTCPFLASQPATAPLANLNGHPSYDEDSNHEPCRRRGYKAHWAVVSGMSRLHGRRRLLGLRRTGLGPVLLRPFALFPGSSQGGE